LVLALHKSALWYTVPLAFPLLSEKTCNPSSCNLTNQRTGLSRKAKAVLTGLWKLGGRLKTKDSECQNQRHTKRQKYACLNTKTLPHERALQSASRRGIP
jgi:hypothetical protein